MHLRSLFSFISPKKSNRALLPLASTASLVALTSLTSPAKALDFNWQFNNEIGSPTTGGIVTGTISGLLDNTFDQISGLTITVTSAPNTPTRGWDYNNFSYADGDGFDVINGQVVGADASFFNPDFTQFLSLSDGSRSYPQLIDFSTSTDNSAPSGITTFTTPVSSVPGPLPILGAASAFGWSRRVRKRLRAAQPASQA